MTDAWEEAVFHGCMLSIRGSIDGPESEFTVIDRYAQRHGIDELEMYGIAKQMAQRLKEK